MAAMTRWHAAGAAIGCALVLLAAGRAGAQSYDLLGAVPDALNHYPGPDGLVISGDDTDSSAITTIIGSDPNFRGDLSYAAGVTFGAGDTDLPLTTLANPDPVNYDAISFLEGTVDLDPTVAAATMAVNQPLVTALDATATAFRQGLGVGGLSITGVNSGSYDPVAHTVTQNVDLLLANAWISAPLADITLTGTAFVVPASDFAGFAANPYVQNEIIPRAQAAGAAGVVFIQARGTLPQTLPFVLFDTPIIINLVGILQATTFANLAIEKTFTGTPSLSPGDTVVYDLAVRNDGPSDATGTAVVDRIPERVSYDSDTCGAGPPSGGLLTWNIGMLANQASVSCQVTVVLDADVNFNNENGATALSDTVDVDLGNNTATVVVREISGGAEGLDQPPNGVSGFQADTDCGACPSGSQAVAENFRVLGTQRLVELVFFGGYTSNVPFDDRFTIQIHANGETVAPGLPGAPGELLATLTAPVRRRATGGLILGSFAEFEYRVSADVRLPRGVYWVVIFNDSSAGTGDWFWETGDLDATRSVTGQVTNVQAPLTPFWTTSTSTVVALQVFTGPAAAAGAPLLGAGALLLLAALLGTLGVVRFRRGGRGAASSR